MQVQELQNSVLHFTENYDLKFHYIHGIGGVQYVDTCEDGNVCRFCGKKSPATSFRKKAHAISELIGNKEFISRTECDVCNSFFGNSLEDNLSKYLGIGRTASQISTKTGVPSYKSKDGKSRVDFDPEKGLVIQDIQGSNFIEKREHSIIIHAVRQAYSPLSVYKSFAKMALSMLPYKDMSYFMDTVSWITEKSNIVTKHDMANYAWMIERFVPGPHPLNLEIWGFFRKDDTRRVPYYQFVISFGNLIEQIAIPCREKDVFESGSIISLVPMPHFYDFNGNPYGQLSTQVKIMSCPTKIKDDPLDICMNVDSYEICEGKEENIEEVFATEGISVKGRLNNSNKNKDKK